MPRSTLQEQPISQDFKNRVVKLNNIDILYYLKYLKNIQLAYQKWNFFELNPIPNFSLCLWLIGGSRCLLRYSSSYYSVINYLSYYNSGFLATYIFKFKLCLGIFYKSILLLILDSVSELTFLNILSLFIKDSDNEAFCIAYFLEQLIVELLGDR